MNVLGIMTKYNCFVESLRAEKKVPENISERHMINKFQATPAEDCKEKKSEY